MFTTVSAAGGAIGLVAGGLLTQWVSWRWVMFVNVPIGLAVWLVARVALVETPRRHGRFDVAGAFTSTLGVAGVVLGLVEAGTKGWTNPLTVLPIAAGAALIAIFVHLERGAEEPVLPLRLLASSTRSAANAARGLVYAGMYGMFFFLSQMMQDVEGYSPVRAGISFLPLPLSVFLSSQVTSKVLVKRVPPKMLMIWGIGLATVSLALSSRLGSTTPYVLVLFDLVMLGAGSGISLVSLTSASLSGVEPADAGAASGLVNVSQQIGAALGLAVLVTVFDAATSGLHTTAGAALSVVQAHAALVHGFDDAFRVGAVFAMAAFAVVALVVKPAPRVSEVRADPDGDSRYEPEFLGDRPALVTVMSDRAVDRNGGYSELDDDYSTTGDRCA
jgi:MFS family permease